MSKRLHFIRGLCAAALLCLSAPLLAAMQLTTVLSGLSSPVFVGHANDSTNRLFIVELGGTIRVRQPGAPGTTVFLDISSKLVSGGEQGLLGLAFHPQYATNGRFFVYYTRAGDGALVIAEYGVSTNRDVADTDETVLLTIAHPGNTNHNGGMLAFGGDGFLYIGVGDGGAGDDPPNNAQNPNELLGKILRIDVNTPDPVRGTAYSSPSDNPYVVSGGGRREIYSIGWRNPWRFSFDRQTFQQWVADVGQGEREEVDTPIVKGGNYGWRVYEGSICSDNDPSLCTTPNNYIPPVFDYTHSGGRCSITGGYVYRGSQGALPQGIYVYGDFCTGEIFTWNGSAQTLELDTTMNISSFGEDEAGEIYVVNLGGSISRIGSTAPCPFGIAPTAQSFPASGGAGSVNVTAGAGCPWTAVANAPWIRVTSGASGSGNGSVGYSVDPNASSSARNGTMTIAGQTFTVTQAGAVACTYSIAPTKATHPAGGVASATVNVTAPAGCPWTAVSNVDWIEVIGPANGSGNATVTYSVDAQPAKARKRNGTMTIAGKRFTVTQNR